MTLLNVWPSSSEPRARLVTVRALILFILLLGAMLRIGSLDARSLWFDEAWTVLHAQKPLDVIWQGPTRPGGDPHPPLYYTGLHYWIEMAGDSELSARYFSALSSTLNIALIYWLGFRTSGLATALAAAALLAVSPLDVWYAQEARMYMVVTTCGLLLTVGLVWRHWLSIVLITTSLVVGLYVDHTMVPLSLGILGLWLVHWWWGGKDRRLLWRTLTAVVLALLFYRPGFSYLSSTLQKINRIHFINTLQERLGIGALSAWHFLLGLAIFMALLLTTAIILQHILRQQNNQVRAQMVTAIVFAGLTLIMAWPRLFTAKRFLVLGWPYIIWFVAWLLTVKTNPRPRLVASLIGVSLAATLLNLALVQKDDWRSAVAYINSHAHSGDVVWIEPSWHIAAYDYYRPMLPGQTGNTEKLKDYSDQRIWTVNALLPGQAKPTFPGQLWLEENMVSATPVIVYRLEVQQFQPDN